MDRAWSDLTGSIFTDPAHGVLVTAEEYLSGNVRDELAHAQTAVLGDPGLQGNVEALAAVQPVDAAGRPGTR